jgi:hypothetical protein
MSWVDVQFSNGLYFSNIAGNSTGQYLIAAAELTPPNNGGVFYSNNGGLSWGQGIGITNSHAVASSANGSIMYASGGTTSSYEGQTMYRSTDGGEHWTALSSQVSASSFGPINTILCNSDGNLSSLIVRLSNRVYKYVGISNTWTQLFSGIPIAAIGRDNTIVVALAGNPSTTPTGFAAIYYSTNDGTSWSSLDYNISNAPNGSQNFSCITFGNGTCYIGSSGALTGGTDYNGKVISCPSASINGSETWTSVTPSGYYCNNIQVFGDQLYILSDNLASITALPGPPSSGLGGLINVNFRISGAPITADPFITNNPPPAGTTGNYNCYNIYVSSYSGLRFLIIDFLSDGYGLLRSI